MTDEPKPRRGPQREQDIELLALIAETYNAAERRQPVRAVLRTLTADDSAYRDQFAYADIASMNRALAKISRRIERARILGLINTDKLTGGRKRITTDSPRPVRERQPARKASRRSPRKES